MGAKQALASALLLVLTTLSSSICAKRHGVASPSGRDIYRMEESVEEVKNQSSRKFVVELATGLAPEGNLGLLLGWLNQPIKGIELYAGFGAELTPSRNYTASIRYMWNLSGYRPYISSSYVFRDLYEIGSFSHNAAVEAGYKWVLHRTYHLTLGVGLRRIVHIGRREDSPLNEPYIDQELLASQEAAVAPYAPTVALRFSRAF